MPSRHSQWDLLEILDGRLQGYSALRTNQRHARVEIANHFLRDGDLFKIDDGQFPGLQN